MALDLVIGAKYVYSHPSLAEPVEVTLLETRGRFAAVDAGAKWDLDGREGRRPNARDTARVQGYGWVSPRYLEVAG